MVVVLLSTCKPEYLTFLDLVDFTTFLAADFLVEKIDYFNGGIIFLGS